MNLLRSKITTDYSWIPQHHTPHRYPQFAGKLLLRQEIPLSDEQIDHLVTFSAFTKVDSIEPHLWGHRCRRCGNKASHLFGLMPHTSCEKECRYCRSCIQMGRVLECEPLYVGSSYVSWPAHENPCAWQGELTVYQQNAADQLVNLVEKGAGEKLVWAVCGAGKTEMLFPAVTKALETGKRVCLATPRTDVVRELLPRFQKAFPEVRMQALYGDSPEKTGDAPLILATTHQLLRYGRAFDVMIVDEVDAFPFHNDESLHYACKRAAKMDASIIYLTATPRKVQKKRMRKKELPVVFVPKRFHGHPLPVPQLKLTPTLHRFLKKGELPPKLLKQIAEQQTSPRQLLVFLPSIKKAEEIALLLKGKGYTVEAVHAEDEDRAEKIAAFREKKYRVLITTTILERGVTFPSVDVFVIDAGHGVFDEAALVQIAGRAGRSHEDPTGNVHFYHIGKTDALLNAIESIEYMNRLGRNT